LSAKAAQLLATKILLPYRYAMQMIDQRHGEAAHYVRPDRVYRTGVIVSTSGYQPNQDVQMVTAAFTEGSPNLGLQGLFGALGAQGNLGFFKKLGLRLKAMYAPRARAAAPIAFMPPAMAAAQNAEITNRFKYGMAYAQIGAQLTPRAMSKLDMLAQLNRGSVPTAVANAQVATSMERWDNMRWNG
jgi:hypothetical protein